jgi:hypothetical protein
MSRAFFTTTAEIKIERNGNRSTNERFEVSFLGVSAKSETLERAMSKVGDKLYERAEALSKLPAAALSEAGAAERATLIDMLGFAVRSGCE